MEIRARLPAGRSTKTRRPRGPAAAQQLGQGLPALPYCRFVLLWTGRSVPSLGTASQAPPRDRREGREGDGQGLRDLIHALASCPCSPEATPRVLETHTVETEAPSSTVGPRSPWSVRSPTDLARVSEGCPVALTGSSPASHNVLEPLPGKGASPDFSPFALLPCHWEP